MDLPLRLRRYSEYLCWAVPNSPLFYQNYQMVNCLMEFTTTRDLERQVKSATKAVEATEKLIRDLKTQASVTADDETQRRYEMKIARLNYRLLQEKEDLAQSEARLRQVRNDFQRFGERNTL